MPAHRDDRASGRITVVLRLYPSDDLLPDHSHKFLHLPLHLLHAFAHLQDDGNTGDVYSQIASEIQNELESLEILISVKACVPFSA